MMIETTFQVICIVTHLLAIKLASSLTPWGVASGVALTHPEQTGGVVVEFVKNSVNSLVDGITNRKQDLLEKEEAERLSKTMAVIGRAQLGNRGSTVVVNPPGPGSLYATAVIAEIPKEGVVNPSLTLNNVMPQLERDLLNQDDITAPDPRRVVEMINTGGVPVESIAETDQSFMLPTASEFFKGSDVLSRNVVDHVAAAKEAFLKKVVGWGVSIGLTYAQNAFPHIPGLTFDTNQFADYIVSKLTSSQTILTTNSEGENNKNTTLFVEGVNKFIESRSFSDYVLTILLMSFLLTKLKDVNIQEGANVNESTASTNKVDSSGRNVLEKDVIKKDEVIIQNRSSSKKGTKKIPREWLEDVMKNIDLKGKHS